MPVALDLVAPGPERIRRYPRPPPPADAALRRIRIVHSRSAAPFPSRLILVLRLGTARCPSGCHDRRFGPGQSRMNDPSVHADRRPGTTGPGFLPNIWSLRVNDVLIDDIAVFS